MILIRAQRSSSYLSGFTLSRQLSAKKYQVVVISPRSHFVFTPLLNSTASGTLEFRTALEPVRNKRLPHIEFEQGLADKLDLHKKTVTVKESPLGKGRLHETVGDGRADVGGKVEEKTQQHGMSTIGKLRDVSYDKLVITVGCYSNTFGTKGVKDHAYFMKDIGGAREIRKRILECFETASLPTTHPEVKKQLLHFAVVGGGPTGMEFAAELSDLIRQDLLKFYPAAKGNVKITVFDVAERVLSMFDKQLVDYAMETYAKGGIEIRTSRHVEELRHGLPKAVIDQNPDVGDAERGYTLKTKQDGEVGIGMCLWSTGNMMNPFIQRFNEVSSLPTDAILKSDSAPAHPKWMVKKNPKTGALVVDSHLRLQVADSSDASKKAVIPSVFALGDNAQLEHASLPVTAQTANQQAIWLAKGLNKDNLEQKQGFQFKNLGIMTYLGSSQGLLQRDAGPAKELRGRAAWLLWRGAYLSKSVSWRNRILIPIYW